MPYGRKCIWIPSDLMELVYQRVEDYNQKNGVVLSVPNALIEILDEYDIMKDAARRETSEC